MASLADIRRQYPQYNDMSDAQLADALYAKHYSDMPRDQFDAKVGFAPSPAPAATPNVMPVGPNGVPRIMITPDAPKPEGPSAAHSLQVGAQGVGRAAADLAGAPFDITNTLLNGLIAIPNVGINAANMVTNGGIPKIPYVGRPGGVGGAIADTAAKTAEAVGVPVIPESDMSQGEKLGYNINRFGTGAMLPGVGLASRVPALATRVTPKLGDWLVRQYETNPARTALGDTAAGVGAGAAENAVQSNDTLKDSPLAHLFAGLIGGTAGASLPSIAEGVANLVRSTVNKMRVDPNVVDPKTGAPYSRSEVEQAARGLQDRTLGAPRAVAGDIRDNAAELARAVRPGEKSVAPSEMPTSGLLSQDPGLVSAEAADRTRQPIASAFVQRDQNVKAAAADRVASLKDPKADQSLPKAVARKASDEAIAAADAKVKAAEGDVTTADAFRQSQAAPIATGANADAKTKASQALDKAVVEDTYLPDRQYKNALYENVPPGTTVDTSKMAAKAGKVQEDVAQLPPSMQGDAANQPVMKDLAQTKSLPYDAATQTRMALSDQERVARGAGEFGKADTTRAVRQPLQESLDAANPEAANYYKNQYGPTYRPGPGDEGQKFTQAIDRDPQRTTTPPSATAGRFLSSPEKVDALKRMVAGAPSEAAAVAAVRDYMRSDFGMSALNPDGTINPARAAAWSKNNADVLAKYPTLKAEFDDITAAAAKGGKASDAAKANLAEMKKGLKATRAEIDNSVAGTLLKKDPRDVAGELLSGGYGAEKKAAEIKALLGKDEQAVRGWKAAVAEVLTDRVTGTKQAGENMEVQYARLANEFKNNEATLKHVFDPEEMNVLRQGHKLLSYFKEAEKRATVGSNTADKVGNIPSWAQLAVRHIYGDLRGGGIVKRFKLLLSILPNDQQSVAAITQQTWFDPGLTAYLLELPLKGQNATPYNVTLKRALALASAGRSSGEPAKKE